MLVQPFLTLLEKLPTRTDLEKITFVKCASFQVLSVFFAAIIGVSSLSDCAMPASAVMSGLTAGAHAFALIDASSEIESPVDDTAAADDDGAADRIHALDELRASRAMRSTCNAVHEPCAPRGTRSTRHALHELRAPVESRK